MNSIRARLLASLIALLAIGVLAAGLVAYRSVLRETQVLLAAFLEIEDQFAVIAHEFRDGD